MNEHTMNIDDLISQYIDGELGSEAEAELHHRLSVSPDDRKRFREQIMLRGVAQDSRVLAVPTPAMRSALFSRLQSEEGMSVAAAVVPAAIAADGAARMSTGLDSDDSQRRVRDGASRAHAADRPAVARHDRRRRLVPILLPFIIGVIATTIMWQTMGTDAERSGDGIAAVDDASSRRAPRTDGSSRESATSPSDSPSAGVFALPESVGTDRDAGSDQSAAGTAAGSAPSDALASRAFVGGGAGSHRAASSDVRPSGPALAIADELEHSRGANDGFASGGARRESTSPVSVTDGASTSRRDDATTLRQSPDQSRPVVEEGQADGAADLAREVQRDGTAYREDIRSSPASTTFAAPRPMAAGAERISSANALAPPPPALAAAPSESESTEQKKSMAVVDGDQSSYDAPRPNDSTSDAFRVRGSMAEGMGAGVIMPIQIEQPAPRRVNYFTSGVRQSTLVAFDDRAVRPEVVIHVGGELDGGTHAIFAMLGLTTFGEIMTTTSDEYRPVPGLPTQEYLYRSDMTASDELRAELWGGAGYRLSIELDDEWRAGVGTWAGYGERFVRVGAELPVAYRVSETVRIEVTPTVQYLEAHGDSREQIRDESTTQATGRMHVNEQSEVDDAEVRAGVSIGVTVVIE